ncbi:LysR family transcriptional regulator [Trichococcus sp. K1Tr]|uniref:LysR family transcriptional regulator n=1 Tax=Trichococcus sp. K1Tr TaxID=3020847 RepID=UPI002330BA6C|nr:LysR family transcriptional regulator [Trichococcus sp. K1Tr]MDB6352998.1 LysR family transcriptional regulator [Trichococcus sp. K1Tr]
MENTTKITYIETIAKHGNITKAANELFISQPYLSKIIQAIEKETGVTIFERTQKFLSLTFAGERYLSYLRKFENLETDMKKELEMISNNKKGKIVFGINQALGTTLLPKILPEFSMQFPGIQIELEEKSAQDLEKMLEDNRVDLSIGMTPVTNQNLSYEYLYEDSVYLLVSEKSRLYNPTATGIQKFPYDLQILNDEPMIMLSPALGLRRLLDEFYTINHLTQKIVLTTSTIYTAIALTKTGMGSTFVPITGMDFSNFSNCNVYEFDRTVLKSKFVLLYKKDRSLTPAVLSFFDIIKRNLGSTKK